MTPVLALDLERTLISDARECAPRPGFATFLAFCRATFPRVVLFTTVEEADARAALAHLVHVGAVSAELVDDLEYVSWVGEYKDLAFVPGTEPTGVLLVDDDAGWIRPDQRDNWVPVAPWDGGPDNDLARVREILLARIA